MSVQIFIEGVRIDLHDNEGINIKLNTQDINDISKVNAGYTKGFSVPASKTNNKLFKHYYNADIIGGFDARTKKSAVIYLDDLEFISGKIRLTSTSLENNEIVDYRIQFEGDVVNIKDLLGDRKLKDLDLAEFNHDYTSANIKQGLTSSLFNGSVVYPLLSSVYRWVFDSSDLFTNTDNTKNIHYDSNKPEQSIGYNELKPAIKVSDLFDKIQQENNLNFVGDFFNRDYFTNLYLWFSNNEGLINTKTNNDSNIINFTNPSPFFSNSNTIDLTLVNDASNFTLRILRLVNTITIPAQFNNVSYSYVITLDDAEIYRQDNITGTNILIYDVPFSLTEQNGLIKFYIITDTVLSYESELTQNASYGLLGINETINYISESGVSNISGQVDLSAQAPDLKQIDLITGIIKMFNIALTAQIDGSILWETLPEFYQNGKEFKDFEKYIDNSKTNIKRGKLISEFKFKYEEPQTILNVQFAKNNKDAYGDYTKELKDENDKLLDGGKLDIQLPFEQVVYERLRNLSEVFSGDLVNFQYGLILDESFNSVVPKNLLFYNINNPSDLIGFQKDDGNTESILGNLNTPNTCTALLDNSKQTINFNAELSTYNFGIMPNSLYNSFYSDYIGDIFSEQRRVYTMDAIIPNFILANIKLNDRLIIQNKRYIINSINSNLTTGKTKLELINDIYDTGDLIAGKFFATPNFILASKEDGSYQSTIFTDKQTTLTLVDEGDGIFASIQGGNTFNSNTTKTFDVQENTTFNQRTMSVLCDNGTETFKITIVQQAQESTGVTFDSTTITFDNNNITFDNQ